LADVYTRIQNWEETEEDELTEKEPKNDYGMFMYFLGLIILFFLLMFMTWKVYMAYCKEVPVRVRRYDELENRHDLSSQF